MNNTQGRHVWRFFTAGGFDQVRLDRGADLLHLDELDQKLWVALSCPVKGLEFDSRTLALIDGDGDGHIRAPELIAAIHWAAARLKSPDTLVEGGPLPLEAIADNEAGRRVLASARHVLESLGKADEKMISVEDSSDSARIFAGTPFNGDGVVTAAAGADLQPLLADIAACLGAAMDRSGEPGVNREKVEAFFQDARAWVEWHGQPAQDPALLPLGEATPAAFTALAAVRDKIDDFFTRCRLAAFDPRAGLLVNSSEDDLRALGRQDLAAGSADLPALPLAWVEAGAPLPLAAGLNPAWEEAVFRLAGEVVVPLLGRRDTLTEAQWLGLKARFAAYAAWQAAEPRTPVAALGLERLRALLEDGSEALLRDLIARDEALAGEADAIDEVERLVRYVRDLGKLANNFVAFRDFYTGRPKDQGGKAIFQAGTLFLDGRSCDLCLKVLDPARHALLATLSGVYLAYCDCVRGGEKMTIAAAFTAGDSDQLMVGRNGIFYDRQGRDWDATITKIVDHPISIRQAFWSPYKKAARLLSEQVQKIAAAKAKAVDDLTAGAVANVGKVPEPARPAPFDAAKFAGIFAAAGLALGALGTALASVVTGFLGLKFWQMPLALAGLLILISGPAVALAFFKLRNRNLGPILDANGWAVNARARINIPFGTALTQTARLPEGAERSLGDPYAEKQPPWTLFFALGALLMGLLIYLGYVVGIRIL